MRILLLSQFYPPVIGGEERHVRNLGAALAQRGHHVSVGTLMRPGSPETELDGAVHVHRLRGTLQRLSSLHTDSERRHAPPLPDPELVLALRRLVREERPDIVHAHNWIYASFLPLKALSGAPLVVTLHDYGLVCAKKNFMHLGTHLCGGPALAKCLPCAATHYGAVKATATALGNWASSFAARRVVDSFIAVSHAVARHTGLTGGRTPYQVIPNFVPDDVEVLGSEDSCLRELPEDGFILFVGDMMRLKGIDVLLKAYARLEQAPQPVLIGRRVADPPTEFRPDVRVFSNWPHSAIMHAWHRSLYGVLPSVRPKACATVIRGDGVRQGCCRERRRRHAGPRRSRRNGASRATRRPAGLGPRNATTSGGSRLAGPPGGDKLRKDRAPQGRNGRDTNRASLPRCPAPSHRRGRFAGAPGVGRAIMPINFARTAIASDISGIRSLGLPVIIKPADKRHSHEGNTPAWWWQPLTTRRSPSAVVFWTGPAQFLCRK